jgi:SAM-dependent methyltransferase
MAGTMNYRELTECIACGESDLELILNLGDQPLANSYKKSKDEHEEVYPLAIQVCLGCFHTQLTVSVDPSLMFKEYLYVSGTSRTQLEYFKWFVDFTEYCLGEAGSRVLDIGCNDGSQLDFYKQKGYDTYGVDPAENLYASSSKNHKVSLGFFNESHKDLGKFDIIVCQNAFAHNTDQIGLLSVAKEMLTENGKMFITISQANMVVNGEFDTIYHEHLSFFTIKSMRELCKRVGVCLVDSVSHPIHGSSLIFVIGTKQKNDGRVDALVDIERSLNLHSIEKYHEYSKRCAKIAGLTKEHLEFTRANGVPVIGLGAAAKGNTFLNYIKFSPNCIIDENPLKQGLYTPGSGSLICPMTELLQREGTETICFLPLAWNFFDEMRSKVQKFRNKKDHFVRYFPAFEIL